MDRMAARYGAAPLPSRNCASPERAMLSSPRKRTLKARPVAMGNGPRHKAAAKYASLHVPTGRQSAGLADHGVLIEQLPEAPIEFERSAATLRSNAQRRRQASRAALLLGATDVRQSACLADHGILIPSPPASPPETPPNEDTSRRPARTQRGGPPEAVDDFLTRLSLAEHRDTQKLASHRLSMAESDMYLRHIGVAP